MAHWSRKGHQSMCVISYYTAPRIHIIQFNNVGYKHLTTSANALGRYAASRTTLMQATAT
jgi:lipopolysaccharide export system protein LptC